MIRWPFFYSTSRMLWIEVMLIEWPKKLWQRNGFDIFSMYFLVFFYTILNPTKRRQVHPLLVSSLLSQIAKSFWKHQNTKKGWWKCSFRYPKVSSTDSFDLTKQRKKVHWAVLQLFQRFKNPSMRLENRIEHAWRIEGISSILQAVHQNPNETHSKFFSFRYTV